MLGILWSKRVLIMGEQIARLRRCFDPRNGGYGEQLFFELALSLTQESAVGLDLCKRATKVGRFLSGHAAVFIEIDGFVSQVGDRGLSRAALKLAARPVRDRSEGRPDELCALSRPIATSFLRA